MSNLNLVLLGPPGAGKGTQAALLRETFDLPYLSTGDLLRRHRDHGTELGLRAAAFMDEGRLVPDDLILTMLMDAVQDGPPRGFLLDGFPRTEVQADALETALSNAGTQLDAVLLIDAPDDVIVARISGRLICPGGHVFHRETAPPARDGTCDHCREPVSRRDDDRAETVRQRLDVYHEWTTPLAAYYESRSQLVRIDGTAPPPDVFAAICAAPAVLGAA
jgi:adenylate kinase